DAGYIAVGATSDLLLDGTLDATPGGGGRGVAVDITSAAIRVVPASGVPDKIANTLDISAQSLTDLGAESILLGGVRTETPAGLQITTRTSSVEIASGAGVAAPELLLAATGQVAIDGGATLAASGKLPVSETQLLLQGDGALLRVAASGDPLVDRTGSIGAS